MQDLHLLPLPRLLSLPRLLPILLLLLPGAATADEGCDHPPNDLEHVDISTIDTQAGRLGRIDFPTSGTPEAQEYFLHGVLNLHSFEYLDARAAFERALEIEPGFAMAAWGLAMSYNHPIWSTQSFEGARAALERFAPTPGERLALAPTEREKGYLQTVEVLYGEGNKEERDIAYRDTLAELSQRFPDDLDIAAFHSLAILGTSHDGRDIATYMQAAAVAEEVFAKNPEHPGAAHYLIHSYDDPVHAPLGMRAARVYAEIAPAATHALHMPSHIFLALGLWDETATSNEDSWQASLDRVERDDLEIDRKSFHALLWLEYAYLQQGRYADARKLLSIMEEDTAASGSEMTRNHLAYMRAHYLLETEAWDDEIASPDLDGLQLSPAATVLYTDGIHALHRGDIKAAEELLAAIKRRREEALAEDGERETENGFVRYGRVRTRSTDIMERQLDARIHLARGKTDEALELLSAAMELEDDARFGFGPPVPPKPSLELFGEVLADLGRYDEAREVLEKSLGRNPRRARTLSTLERAAVGTEDHELAMRTHETLEAMWHLADRRSDQETSAPASR
ncbi:MAG: hypothetical protein AAF657_07045 [Acidobacteriota bacterium]